jgi:hypothetical protein
MALGIPANIPGDHEEYKQSRLEEYGLIHCLCDGSEIEVVSGRIVK